MVLTSTLDCNVMSLASEATKHIMIQKYERDAQDDYSNELC